MPDIPRKTDKQALAAETASSPQAPKPPAELPRSASAAAVLPEESEKPAQAATQLPPVTPPEPPKSDTPVEDAPARIARLQTPENLDSLGSGGRDLVSFLISALVHAGLMVVLALLVAVSQDDRGGWDNSLILSTSAEDAPLDIEDLISNVRQPNTVRRHDALLSAPPSDRPDVNPIKQLPAPTRAPMRIGNMNLYPGDWATRRDTATGGGLEGRTARAKGSIAGDGASDESEAAVERGLWWLVAHQREDGSWNFDHGGQRCRGLCANPGNEKSTTAATAMALAPFLGAGYTHQDGQHKEAVRRGLYYLMSRAFESSDGLNFCEGTMYDQGLAAIVLSEAYAMTDDVALKGPAQGALDYIETAQHKEGGGWRYDPGQPGDTTVTGWQFMALKSGEMAHLNVKSPTMMLVNQFLDSVQSEEGAKYGYQDTRPRPATTAVGLLCRMYLGWSRLHPGLRGGVEYLDKTGPSDNDMYFNYYATQVMHHWQGSAWKRWNDHMRDYLVQTQDSQGHQAGSWYFPHEHSTAGGRLYNTAMAIMTLEVYYRYMPLYKTQAYSR